MPTNWTGRHTSRQRSVLNHGNLYPALPQADIEMTDFEERRKWRDVFDRFDHDHDGEIPLSELSNALNSVSANGIPAEVVNELAWRADRDHNGVLDFDEFMNLVRSHELGALQPKFHFLLKSAAFTVVPRTQRPQFIATHLQDAQETYSCCPPPLLMPILSMAELGVFIYYCIEMGSLSANGPVPFNSPLIYDPYRRYEAWRFCSYMLIHSGYVHIATNLLVQLVLGIPLEMVHGWWRLLLVYLAGVIAGSLGTSITDPSVYLAGASGGVYALLLAHLASVILNWKEMEFAIFRLLFIVILIAVDVGVAIYYRHIGEDTKVGYAAHFAGAVAGLLVGVNILRNLQVEKWEKVVMWVCLFIYMGLMVAMIAANIFWVDHFPKSKY